GYRRDHAEGSGGYDKRSRQGFFPRGRGRRRCHRLRLGALSHVERVDAHRVRDVLELDGAEIADLQIESAFDMAIAVLGEDNSPRRVDPLHPRSDVATVAHQVAVALLDHVAEMNADAELNAALF